MARNGYEEAPEWLARVSIKAKDPNVRSLAANALGEWNRLLDSWESRGVRTRRSLYDLLAGLLQISRNYRWNTHTVTVRSGADRFTFPIFTEACDYRGRAHPTGAIQTGIRIQSHRKVQKKKWGNDVLKT
jgi:hypothetical protein